MSNVLLLHLERCMRHSPHRRLPMKLSVLVILTALGTGCAQAQRDASASKAADLSVFGGYTYSHPDYASFHNNGFTAGIDYTRYLRWPIIPSFEIRANHNTGKIMDQESALGGLRLQADLRRFHPYADALFGGTEITYHFPPDPHNPHDRAFTTSIGGGVDIDLVRSFSAKFDFQEQFENYGPNGTKVDNSDFTLSPTFFTIGVVYHIPFGSRNGRWAR